LFCTKKKQKKQNKKNTQFENEQELPLKNTERDMVTIFVRNDNKGK